MCSNTLVGYTDAINHLKKLIEDGWEIIDEPSTVVSLRNLDGKSYSLLAALYFSITGEDSNGLNLFTLLVVDSILDKRAYEKFQYGSEHPEHDSHKNIMRDLVSSNI